MNALVDEYTHSVVWSLFPVYIDNYDNPAVSVNIHYSLHRNLLYLDN